MDCKACGRELVQAGGGHRRREYCDENCRQLAFRLRREQQHKDAVAARWARFTPGTQQFLDWLTQKYGEALAGAVEIVMLHEIAIARESSRQEQERGPGNRDKLQAELAALGERLHWRRLIIGQTMISAGEESWRLYIAQTEDADLSTAIGAARFYYDNLKSLGMI